MNSKRETIITDERFENLEIALNGAIKSKNITETDANFMRETVNSLVGKSTLMAPLVVSSIAMILPPAEALALIDSLEPMVKLKQKELIIDKLKGTISKEKE